MTFIYNPLLIALGIGVVKIAGKKQSLRLIGVLLTVWGMLGFVWLLFPMHLRGAIGSTTDTMHLVMTGITVVLMVALLLIGAGTQGKWFRGYSYISILAMAFFGTLTGQQASRVADQLPTPWMGITERLCSYPPLIWVIVLSTIFLVSKKKLAVRH